MKTLFIPRLYPVKHVSQLVNDEGSLQDMTVAIMECGHTELWPVVFDQKVYTSKSPWFSDYCPFCMKKDL